MTPLVFVKRVIAVMLNSELPFMTQHNDPILVIRLCHFALSSRFAENDNSRFRVFVWVQTQTVACTLVSVSQSTGHRRRIYVSTQNFIVMTSTNFLRRRTSASDKKKPQPPWQHNASIFTVFLSVKDFTHMTINLFHSV